MAIVMAECRLLLPRGVDKRAARIDLLPKATGLARCEHTACVAHPGGFGYGPMVRVTDNGVCIVTQCGAEQQTARQPQ